jgi:hypothetical protein
MNILIKHFQNTLINNPLFFFLRSKTNYRTIDGFQKEEELRK